MGNTIKLSINCKPEAFKDVKSRWQVKIIQFQGNFKFQFHKEQSILFKVYETLSLSYKEKKEIVLVDLLKKCVAYVLVC